MQCEKYFTQLHTSVNFIINKYYAKYVTATINVTVCPATKTEITAAEAVTGGILSKMVLLKF